MNNSIIILRGVKAPIVVSELEAKEVDKIWQSKIYPADHVINIGRTSFRKGQINYIELNPNGAATDKWDEKVRKDMQEEKENRRNFLMMSPKEKSENLEMFKTIVKAYTNPMREATEEEIEKAKGVQFDFFKLNPDRVFCDAKLLSDIISENDMGRMTPVQDSVSRFLESCYSTDYRLSKQTL